MPAGRRFATTRWSLVLDAREGGPRLSEQALTELCESYWYPLYAFVRRQGHSAEDAADLTQEYFAKLLEKDYLQDVRPEAGRFRSFLLVSLKHFLYNEWDKEKAQKRGGHLRRIPLDGDSAETRYTVEPVDLRTPEDLYERRWAMTVLERVLDRLAHVIRDRLSYRRQLRVATGAAKASAIMVALIAPLIFMFFFFIRPEYISEMLESTLGQTALVFAAFSQIVGLIWTARLLKPMY